MTRFSIITVTLNNLTGLRKTAASLAHQDPALYEWIVIDGDSNDGTKDWLKQSAAQWLSEPDKGIYDAMNKGIARAKGEYLLFLNAGDTLAGDHTLEKLAMQAGPDFIYGDALEETGTGKMYKPARSHTRKARGMFTHHQAMAYRRAALGGLRYDLKYRLAADYDLTCRFLQQNISALYAPFAICVFEKGGISQSQAASARREEFQIRQTLKLCGPMANRLVFSRQTLAHALKTLSPQAYTHLRTYIN